MCVLWVPVVCLVTFLDYFCKLYSLLCLFSKVCFFSLWAAHILREISLNSWTQKKKGEELLVFEEWLCAVALLQCLARLYSSALAFTFCLGMTWSFLGMYTALHTCAVDYPVTFQIPMWTFSSPDFPFYFGKLISQLRAAAVLNSCH